MTGPMQDAAPAIGVSADEAPLHRVVIGDDLTVFSGQSRAVAQIVADRTGETIVAPYRIGAFMDGEGNTLVVILHAIVDAGAMVTFVHDGIRLSPAIIRGLFEALGELGLSEVATAVPLAALETRDTLRRLGFRRFATCADLQLMVLRTAEAPPRLLRRASRRAN